MVEYAYDAWGDCTTVSDTTLEKIGTLNPFRYKDYYYDWETGWYYLNARYYDPDVGRFLNADSVEYLGADGSPLSYNRYVYCGNNPVMYADPSGHLFGLITIGVLAFMFTPIGGTVAQAAVSTVSYAGMAVASIWDEDIRADMNAIGWNPFNTNESAVLGSNKVSFYKGMPVFRTNGDRSGTFYVIVAFFVIAVWHIDCKGKFLVCWAYFWNHRTVYCIDKIERRHIDEAFSKNIFSCIGNCYVVFSSNACRRR